MPKPKKCPKCGASSDEISSAYEMADLFDLHDDSLKEWFCSRCSLNFDDEDLVGWHDDVDLSELKLSQIADIIYDDWKNISPNAHPYVEAMSNLNNLEDSFGSESAFEVVEYFLANAHQWKGPTARKVKEHLKKSIKQSENKGD